MVLCRVFIKLHTTVWVFAMARHLKTVSRKYAQKLIVVQMFNYFRLPCFCQTGVGGRHFVGHLWFRILYLVQVSSKIVNTKYQKQKQVYSPFCTLYLCLHKATVKKELVLMLPFQVILLILFVNCLM